MKALKICVALFSLASGRRERNRVRLPPSPPSSPPPTPPPTLSDLACTTKPPLSGLWQFEGTVDADARERGAIQ